MVHQYNGINAPPKVAYTFDAGPNAVLYLLKQEVEAFVRFLQPYIQQSVNDGSIPCNAAFLEVLQTVSAASMPESLSEDPLALRRIIYTRVGDGPQRIL